MTELWKGLGYNETFKGRIESRALGYSAREKKFQPISIISKVAYSGNELMKLVITYPLEIPNKRVGES